MSNSEVLYRPRSAGRRAATYIVPQLVIAGLFLVGRGLPFIWGLPFSRWWSGLLVLNGMGLGWVLLSMTLLATSFLVDMESTRNDLEAEVRYNGFANFGATRLASDYRALVRNKLRASNGHFVVGALVYLDIVVSAIYGLSGVRFGDAEANAFWATLSFCWPLIAAGVFIPFGAPGFTPVFEMPADTLWNELPWGLLSIEHVQALMAQTDDETLTPVADKHLQAKLIAQATEQAAAAQATMSNADASQTEQGASGD